MNDSTQQAIAVLIEIAEDAENEPDTRIRAAATLLNHTESVRQGHTAPKVEV